MQPPKSTPYSIFVVFYITAIFLEIVKEQQPIFVGEFFLVSAFLIFTPINRIKFLFFLVVSTLHLLTFRFPDVANHVNLIVFCNLLMISAMIYSFLSKKFNADENFFKIIQPSLRVTLVITYFLAGFHKLNKDYFNPEVGCHSTILNELIAGFGLSNITLAESFLFSIAILTLIWEVLGAFFLVIPKLQWPIIVLAYLIHSVLALVNFVDFSALSFALLLTFIPPSYYKILDEHSSIRIFNLNCDRTHLYFTLNAAGGILYSIYLNTVHFVTIRLIYGLIFNLAFIIFIWPILSVVLRPSIRPPWTGVAVFSKITPSFMYLFYTFLLFFGINPYLGLRTAGTFSMFSNLRTEGEFSNHILLRQNPIKIWTYQEDVIKLIKIDNTLAKTSLGQEKLQGYELPIVEFRKLIYLWTKAGHKVPITFEYQGRRYSSEDITQAPNWKTHTRSWAMKLMDFRIIQPYGSGPNRCRW